MPGFVIFWGVVALVVAVSFVVARRRRGRHLPHDLSAGSHALDAQQHYRDPIAGASAENWGPSSRG